MPLHCTFQPQLETTPGTDATARPPAIYFNTSQSSPTPAALYLLQIAHWHLQPWLHCGSDTCKPGMNTKLWKNPKSAYSYPKLRRPTKPTPQYNTVQSVPKLPNVIQSYPKLSKAIHSYSKLFKVIQSYPKLSKAINSYSKLSKVIPPPKATPESKAIQRYPKLSKATLSKTIQCYTKVLSCPKLSNLFQNLSKATQREIISVVRRILVSNLCYEHLFVAQN